MRGGTRSPTLTFSGLAHLCSHPQVVSAGLPQCLPICCSWYRGQLPAQPVPSQPAPSSFVSSDTLLSTGPEPFCLSHTTPDHTSAHSNSACLSGAARYQVDLSFSSEPGAERPRPACGSPSPTQVAALLAWAMLPHHTEIITVSSRLVPVAPVRHLVGAFGQVLTTPAA